MRGGIAASLRHNRSTHITHGSGAQRTSEIHAHSAENGLISACRITHSSKTAFELYTSQCKKRFCQVRRSHSGLYSRASVEPSTGWRVRMFGCETSGGRLCWLRCCQPHRRSKTGTIFFYGLVIKGVASPPPRHIVPPTQVRWGGLANDPPSPQPSARARFGGYLRACVPRAGEGFLDLVPYPLGRASSIGRQPGERVEVASGIRTRRHLEARPWVRERDSAYLSSYRH